MDLSDLRAFLQVLEHGSFQRAAAASRSSRAGLRRAVERLEKELDVPLLRRGARGVEPTAAGKELQAGAGGLLRDAELLAARARESRVKTRGLLRFIVPLGVAVEPRARALTMLRAAHPELDLCVREAEDPLTLLSEPFDLMFHFGDAPDREGWFSRVFVRVPAVLQASADYLERHGAPTSLEALGDHALLQWSAPGERSRELPLRGGGTHPSSPWLRSANVELLQLLAREGRGLLFAPVFPPAFGGPRPPLIPVLTDIIGSTVVLRALSPRASRVDARVRAVQENVKKLLVVFGEPGHA